MSAPLPQLQLKRRQILVPILILGSVENVHSSWYFLNRMFQHDPHVNVSTLSSTLDLILRLCFLKSLLFISYNLRTFLFHCSPVQVRPFHVFHFYFDNKILEPLNILVLICEALVTLVVLLLWYKRPVTGTVVNVWSVSDWSVPHCVLQSSSFTTASPSRSWRTWSQSQQSTGEGGVTPVNQ